MNVSANFDIHNRFDFVVRNAETGEIEQTGKAENIIKSRMYDRLSTFNTYFVNIVFGTGIGTPSPDNSVLFNRIGAKTAQDETLIRSFPLSTWVRKIRLETTEYNGQELTEVGISDTTTNVNTHAMIQDAEGNPITLEKNETRIIDIYATVFITLQDVDEGLRFTGTGLRDYLTGASMASDQLALIYEGLVTPLSSVRSSNASEQSVQTAVTFNVQHHNYDVQAVRWVNTGITWDLPRRGVFEGWDETGVVLGAGDGENRTFAFPVSKVKDVTAYVDGIQDDNWEFDMFENILFDTPPPTGQMVTSDFTCVYQPKDINHILKVTAKLRFNVTQPSPEVPIVVPDNSGLIIPGRQTPIAGDSTYGFYGEVPVSQLMTGEELRYILKLSAGTLQNSDEPYLKFALDGKILFVAKKTISHTISWDQINAVGAVSGKEILGGKVKVRLLSTEEWNALMYPIHVDHPSGAPNWANYTDEDLLVHNSYGNGSYSWTSTISGSNRVFRGISGVSNSGASNPSNAHTNNGFRPVFEMF